MPKMFLFWKPKAPIPPEERVPVTLLSGFLGAGKTTLLNHLLASGKNGKLAVLVNDLGEVNIDASLIKRSVRKLKSPISGMMELTSGCICCGIQTELMDALLHLYRKYQPDHILIEATGVAEPKSILETLYAANLEKVRGTDFLRVANLVTVVDAANLGDFMHLSGKSDQTKRQHLLPADRRRPLEELLMEQLECADVIVLNKTDLVEPDQVDRLSASLGGINAKAAVHRCEQGQIDAEALLGQSHFDEAATLTAARWRRLILTEQGDVDERADTSQAMNVTFDGFRPAADPPAQNKDGRGLRIERKPSRHHHLEYGLDSFVFKGRRPFDEARFYRFLRSELPGLVRAKGFYWTNRMPDRVGLLSIAGKVMRTDYMGRWWAEQIRDGEATEGQLPEEVRQRWHPEHGDRRQELVFIGVDLRRAEIIEQLRACECPQEEGVP